MSKIKNPSVIDTINAEIYKTLDDIGVPQHLLGYDYSAYGVQYLLDRLPKEVYMTKEVYPSIAEAFGTTPSRVERAIRHCASCVFDYVDSDILHKYFGNSIYFYKGKPNNSQFLYAITRHVRRKLSVQ